MTDGILITLQRVDNTQELSTDDYALFSLVVDEVEFLLSKWFPGKPFLYYKSHKRHNTSSNRAT